MATLDAGQENKDKGSFTQDLEEAISIKPEENWQHYRDILEIVDNLDLLPVNVQNRLLTLLARRDCGITQFTQIIDQVMRDRTTPPTFPGIQSTQPIVIAQPDQAAPPESIVEPDVLLNNAENYTIVEAPTTVLVAPSRLEPSPQAEIERAETERLYPDTKKWQRIRNRLEHGVPTQADWELVKRYPALVEGLSAYINVVAESGGIPAVPRVASTVTLVLKPDIQVFTSNELVDRRQEIQERFENKTLTREDWDYINTHPDVLNNNDEVPADNHVRAAGPAVAQEATGVAAAPTQLNPVIEPVASPERPTRTAADWARLSEPVQIGSITIHPSAQSDVARMLSATPRQIAGEGRTAINRRLEHNIPTVADLAYIDRYPGFITGRLTRYHGLPQRFLALMGGVDTSIQTRAAAADPGVIAEHPWSNVDASRQPPVESGQAILPPMDGEGVPLDYVPSVGENLLVPAEVVDGAHGGIQVVPHDRPQVQVPPTANPSGITQGTDAAGDLDNIFGPVVSELTTPRVNPPADAPAFDFGAESPVNAPVVPTTGPKVESSTLVPPITQAVEGAVDPVEQQREAAERVTQARQKYEDVYEKMFHQVRHEASRGFFTWLFSHTKEELLTDQQVESARQELVRAKLQQIRLSKQLTRADAFIVTKETVELTHELYHRANMDGDEFNMLRYSGGRFLDEVFTDVGKGVRESFDRTIGEKKWFRRTRNWVSRYWNSDETQTATSRAAHLAIRAGYPAVKVLILGKSLIPVLATMAASAGTVAAVSALERVSRRDSTPNTATSTAGIDSMNEEAYTAMLREMNTTETRRQYFDRIEKKAWRWTKSGLAMWASLLAGEGVAEYREAHGANIPFHTMERPAVHTAPTETLSSEQGPATDSFGMPTESTVSSSVETIQQPTETWPAWKRWLGIKPPDNVVTIPDVDHTPVSVPDPETVSSDGLSTTSPTMSLPDNHSVADVVNHNVSDESPIATGSPSSAAPSDSYVPQPQPSVSAPETSPHTPSHVAHPEAASTHYNTAPVALPEIQHGLSGEIIVPVAPNGGFTDTFARLLKETPARNMPDWVQSFGSDIQHLTREQLAQFATQQGTYLPDSGHTGYVSLVMEPNDALYFDTNKNLVFSRDGHPIPIRYADGSIPTGWTDAFQFKNYGLASAQ